MPNYTSFDATYYKKYWAAYDLPRHLYHFSPKSMSILLNEIGFEIVSLKPMWYDSFYVSLLSEKYKQSGKLGTLLAGFVGFAGIHRFVTERIGLGLVYFFTGGFLLIGTIVDLIRHKKIARKLLEKTLKGIETANFEVPLFTKEKER